MLKYCPTDEMWSDITKKDTPGPTHIGSNSNSLMKRGLSQHIDIFHHRDLLEQMPKMLQEHCIARDR